MIKYAKFYLANTKRVNNWDLVDTSAEYVLGPYSELTGTDFVYKLSRSKDLWERRIAILTTFYLIKKGNFNHTLKLAQNLMNDKHDLIQKALGWMLREIGKRDESILIKFLIQHYKQMPRTMLRYALERLSSKQKKLFMAK